MTEAELLDRIRGRLAAAGDKPTATAVTSALEHEQRVFSRDTVLDLVDTLRAESVGAGPLQRLLALSGVTDVLVNGTAGVFIDRGRGLEPAEVAIGDADAVRRLAQRLAAQAGRRLDDASPWVDARLPDGTRLHAVLGPMAQPGPAISLRVLAARSFTVDELHAVGSVSDEIADWLRRLVEGRAALIVTGGTGSGKTTVLAALLTLVSPGERIVIVEEASELRPDHPHVLLLEARPPNVEGAGTVTAQDLVRQALRMRPDRLVVGEVRGAEVVDLLAALNTGHAGGCGTVHANSPRDVPARFEALGVAAGLPRQAVHSQLAAGVQAIVHLNRRADGTRRVAEIATLTTGADGLVSCVPAVDADGTPDLPGRHALTRIAGSG